jgi:hypothetical protein
MVRCRWLSRRRPVIWAQGVICAPVSRERGPAVPQIPPSQRSVSIAPGGDLSGLTIHHISRSLGASGRRQKDPAGAERSIGAGPAVDAQQGGPRRGVTCCASTERGSRADGPGAGGCESRKIAGCSVRVFDEVRRVTRTMTMCRTLSLQGPFRWRRPGALRNQQAEEVANVGDLDRALTGIRSRSGPFDRIRGPGGAAAPQRMAT